MLQHCIVCAYKNILSLIETFLYIINHRYSEVMYAKYCRSRMNNACTQYVRLTLLASLQKSYD